MKLLLDTCVSADAARALQDRGYDVVRAGDWEQDPGDEAILRLAYEQGRVLVTLDKDFGELAVLRRQPHAGIMRLVGLASREQGPGCHQVLEGFGTELEVGAIVTVERDRVRVRSADAGHRDGSKNRS